MASEKQSVFVDKDLRPAYYDDFHCLAAGCKLSCCKGWSITFNKKDYLSLKRQSGSQELNARLGHGLRRLRKDSPFTGHYGEFNMDSGVCPLLGEDSLCTLQVEKGHAALPLVCRRYPRTESYMASGYLERSISPSCEGVLALLWDLSDGIDFRSDPLPRSQHRQVNISEDSPMLLWFPVVREWCIDILQNRYFTLPQRIWVMGLGLKELTDDESDIKHWIKRAVLLPNQIDPAQMPRNTPKEQAIVLTGNIRTLISMQSTDLAFDQAREEIIQALPLSIRPLEKQMNVPMAEYSAACEQYAKKLTDREHFMENLMVSVFFHLHMPIMSSRENLWKSYVNFCNLYAFYQFMAVMSCREGVEDTKAELFRLIALASRSLLHNNARQQSLRDEFFQNNSATLAHMAILLGG